MQSHEFIYWKILDLVTVYTYWEEVVRTYHIYHVLTG